MKRRLRKKKRKGEFSEWGVSVVAKFCSKGRGPTNDHSYILDPATPLTHAEAHSVDEIMDHVLDKFIEFLEARGWYCGGSISPEGTFDFIVEFGRDDKLLARHSDTLLEWLRTNNHLEEVVVSQPINLWYPPKDNALGVR